jgi:hypothetical protein
MKTVKEKLGVKPSKEVCVINAPNSYREVQSTTSIDRADIVQVFVSSKKEVQDFIEQNLSKLKKMIALWVTYPKNSSHLGVNRDLLAQYLANYGLEAVAICAIDDKWSALRFKIK